MKHIVVCIPTRGLIHSRTIEDLFNNSGEAIIGYEFAHGLPVPEANNVVTEKALAKNPDYLWYIDDDMHFPPDTLKQLLKLDADIAIADYPVDKDKPVTRYDERGVLYSGLGCALVKTQALKKLEQPYFRTDTEYTHPDMTPVPVKNPEKRHGLHDIDFFIRARQAGLTIKVIDKTVGQYHYSNAPKGNNTAFAVERWRL